MAQKSGNKNYLAHIPTSNEELWDALVLAYQMAKRGKMRTADQHKFEVRWYENLRILYFDIIYRTYNPSRSKAFITHNPVDREIFAAPFRDRVVHHLIYGICGSWWNRHFIYDSYSCIPGKGTKVGVERIQHFMRSAVQEDKRNGRSGKEVRVLKRDLSGYFMSLEREVLYKRVMFGLDRQFPDKGYTYRLMEFLWRKIIFDDPIEGVRVVGKKSDWEKLPPNKSLFHQPPGKGIVIGNQTSQLLSNIMLDLLDRYVTIELGFKRYGRYVDDFIIVATEEEYPAAKEVMMEKIPKFLARYGLRVHPKKIYNQRVGHGVSFLGQYIYLSHITLGKRTARNFYKAAMDYSHGKGGEEAIVSYLGMGKYTASAGLNAKVFESVGWRYYYT